MIQVSKEYAHKLMNAGIKVKCTKNKYYMFEDRPYWMVIEEQAREYEKQGKLLSGGYYV